MPELMSVQVALPEERHDARGVWVTAIFKRPVEGAVKVGRLGLEGDRVADPSLHGGAEKAVLVYSVEGHARYQPMLSEPLYPGAFGENLTVRGLPEDVVNIGDVLEIGSAKFEVCQPRPPCWKLARKLAEPRMVKWVMQAARPGYYLRVLREGALAAGDEVRVVASPFPGLTVERCFRLFYGGEGDEETLRAFAECPPLASQLLEAARGEVGS